jgi:signal peptidase II
VRSSRGVVDFLDIGIGNIRWPIFNVADIAVTTGAIFLAVSLWQEERQLDRPG